MSTRKDLTVLEVAESLGIAYDTVRRLLKSGDLKGYKVDLKQWRVTPNAIVEFKDGGGVRRPGRPAKN